MEQAPETGAVGRPAVGASGLLEQIGVDGAWKMV